MAARKGHILSSSLCCSFFLRRYRCAKRASSEGAAWCGGLHLRYCGDDDTGYGAAAEEVEGERWHCDVVNLSELVDED